MGLLDDDYKTPQYIVFRPRRAGRRYEAENDRLTEEQRLAKLNNLNHEIEPEDYSKSNHLNY